MEPIFNNRKVSVIIPVYNAETTIVRALESVVLQTYTDWEVYIINDGSIDGSINVIDNYLQKLPSGISDKIFVYTQNNSGPSKARNKGIEKATGRFIAFLDSDDEWISQKLEKQIFYCKEKKYALISGGFNTSIYYNVIVDKIEINLSKLLIKNHFMTCSVLVDLEVINKKYVFFNENQKYSEDQRLWLTICADYSCIYINEVVCKSITNKHNYGASGLSSQMLKMEKGELSNFRYLYNLKKISFLEFAFYSQFSLLKYAIRIIRVKFRKK